MDGQRLDQLARAIGKRGTRRQALRAGIVGVAGLTAVRFQDADATIIPCAITCPPVTQVSDPSLCGAIVTFQILPDLGTTCTEIVCDQTSGTLFPVGSTSVHCNDTNGRADCDFTITVTDAEPPAVTCPANIEITGPVPATVTFTAFASDNCPGVSINCDRASGSEFDAGTTVVTCTATDASGTETSCEFNVTVISDATATPTETATTEPTDTPTEAPPETSTPGPTSTAEATLDPATETPAVTEAPATVAPTSVPAAPTATEAPVSQLPNTGSGSSGNGIGKLGPIAAAGAGAALLTRLGLRRRSELASEAAETNALDD